MQTDKSEVVMSTNDELHVVLDTGPAGQTLIDELVGRGHQVRSVDRRGEAQLPDGVQQVTADLADPKQAADAARGASVVYHCVNVPYHRQVELMPGIGEAIRGAARAAGARLVVLDTLYPLWAGRR
jgi:uncharacterized protein YbjT (DUF2867 family)